MHRPVETFRVRPTLPCCRHPEGVEGHERPWMAATERPGTARATPKHRSAVTDPLDKLKHEGAPSFPRQLAYSPPSTMNSAPVQ